VLFLSGVGTNAGFSFAETLRSQGLQLLLAGAVLTVVVNALGLILGHKLLKLPFDYPMGLTAGIQTQAAGVAYADEVTRSEARVSLTPAFIRRP
jgi:putative transport protein